MSGAEKTIWPHFTAHELRCRCGQCGLGWRDMNVGFMDMLEELRQHLGFPLIVSSAIRCPAWNNFISSTGQRGPHTTGRAIDIAISGPRARDLAWAALDFGFTGIGLLQHGHHDERFIHLDNLTEADGFPRPLIWTYP